MTAAQSPGWEGLLDPDERIVWQGRPDGGWHFKAAHLVALIFGLFFSGFALFWMVMAAQAGGHIWMFGLIHFTVGLAVMVGGPLADTYTRRHSHYTLTDRRAFIATDMPLLGRKLKSYPITAETVISFEDGPLASIYFASRQVRRKSGRRSIPIGFERIENGRHVLALIRQAQANRAPSLPSDQRQMP
jgi:hypothetical protein